MADIFARVYLDEDVNVVIAAVLRSRHFIATTTVETGNRGTSDAKQLEYCTANGFVLLTHNRSDFEKLAADSYAASTHHNGIIIAVRRKPPEILRRLFALLDRFTADEFKNQVLYI